MITVIKRTYHSRCSRVLSDALEDSEYSSDSLSILRQFHKPFDQNGIRRC